MNTDSPQGYQTANVLDLVCTNEEIMILGVKFISPLGKSHHSVVSFEFHCYAVKNSSDVVKLAYSREIMNCISHFFIENKAHLFIKAFLEDLHGVVRKKSLNLHTPLLPLHNIWFHQRIFGPHFQLIWSYSPKHAMQENEV